MSRFAVTFVTRRNCPLCVDAEVLLARWARRTGGVVDRKLIEEDMALAQAYAERVPVILGPDGSVLAEGSIKSIRLGPAMVRARLAQRRRR